MYRARDQVDQSAWLDELAGAAKELGLGEDVRSCAADLFLSSVPGSERSKPASLAASLYAASLICGDERSQVAVADTVGVSRLVIHQRWKGVLEAAGFEAPNW